MAEQKSSVRETKKLSLAAAAVYTALFIAATAVYMVVNLDTGALKKRVERLASEKSGLDISIGKLGVSVPPGVTLNNVRIVAKDMELEGGFDSLNVGLSILGLIRGTAEGAVRAESDEGNLNLDFSGALNNSGGITLKIRTESFPVHKLITRWKNEPLPVKMELDSTGNIKIPRRSPLDAAGSFDITLSDIKPSGGPAMAMFSGIFPKKARCRLSLDKRRLTTKECKANSPMGGFELRISTVLAEKIEETPLSGFLVIHRPSGLLKQLLAGQARFKKKDGSFSLPLAGTVAFPSLGL